MNGLRLVDVELRRRVAAQLDFANSRRCQNHVEDACRKDRAEDHPRDLNAPSGALAGQNDQERRGSQQQQTPRGNHRGTSIRCSTSAAIWSGVRAATCASAVSSRRCRRTAGAADFTSSGVTNSRPLMPAML